MSVSNEHEFGLEGLNDRKLADIQEETREIVVSRELRPEVPSDVIFWIIKERGNIDI